MKTRSKRSTTSGNIGLLLGAHESIEGGIHKAIERAESIGCSTLQIFTKNSNQWVSRPLKEQDVENYKNSASKSKIRFIMAHSIYLINLCAADPLILKKSRDALVDEINRCDLLGIPIIIFHPGSHMGSGESTGIKKIIESINRVHDKTPASSVKSVLETTAGQGTSIGYRFEHLREIIEGVENRNRIGVCVDTCHIFAAGYNISSETGYEKTIEEFDRIIGLELLEAIHINDSKKDLGSRIDRHEHIGKGLIGKVGFRCLMQDKRLISIPKVIETEKGKDLREDLINLKILRRLAGKNK